MIGESFPVDMPEGVVELVGKARAAINVRFHGGDKPDVHMTDKGQRLLPFLTAIKYVG